MNSRIAESIKLAAEPVALLWSDTLPEDAAMFEKDGGAARSFLEGDTWKGLSS